jgi:hypothetical protein
MQCICPCIEPEVAADCACPICVDTSCRLSALKSTVGCLICDSSPLVMAIQSPSKFQKAASCEDEVIPEMERSGSSEPFYIRPLRCCVLPGEIASVAPCESCRTSSKLPIPVCPCFSDMNREVSWLKRQDTIEGANSDRVTIRLRSYLGPLRELIDEILSNVKPYLHHLWGARFLRRQFHLDCDFFQPTTEALLLADFASAMVDEMFDILSLTEQ